MQKLRIMCLKISADSLKSHINKLVSFGTRHTMSSTTDAKKELVLLEIGCFLNLKLC